MLTEVLPPCVMCIYIFQDCKYLSRLLSTINTNFVQTKPGIVINSNKSRQNPPFATDCSFSHCQITMVKQMKLENSFHY